jgi:hypothetical protein
MASIGGGGGGGGASGPALLSDIAMYLEAYAKAANNAVAASLGDGTLASDIGKALCSVGVASAVVSAGGDASAPTPPVTWSVSLFRPCNLAEFVAGVHCALATTGKAIAKCGKKLPPERRALAGVERETAEAARRAEVANSLVDVLQPWLAE